MRSLLLSSAVLAAFAFHAPAPVDACGPYVDLRDQGPAALDALLAQYDRLDAGPVRDALANEIDRVAAQRYATVSRLYWYTDLAAAEAEATRTGRPILSLRMLGRLDEDLSCANSRLFRATLYADAAVSKLLRDRFVLHWSSERAVPKVTIDMGDGRTIRTTTTGNSAHYVLDARGHVLDVLPGLYAPVAFRTELAKSLALAARVRGVDDAVRIAAVRRYHQALESDIASRWTELAPVPYIANSQRLTSAVAQAQRATMAKAMMEIPVLRTIGMDVGKVDDPAMWAAAAMMLYKISDRAPVILDERSRALVARLYAAETPAERDLLPVMMQRLEHHVVADTGKNQLELRAAIAHQIAVAPAATFDQLNAFIYDVVFHTPRSDAWLGLVPRTDFTGLPNDGRS